MTTTPTPRTPTTASASPTLARASSKTHRLQRDKRNSNASNRPRPRKQPKPVPPTLKDKVKAVREHAYFWPSVVLSFLVLGGLVWQAINIASHADQTMSPYTQPPPKPKTSSASPPSASPASATPATPVRPIEDRVAEAVQGALSDAWNLDDVDPSAEPSAAPPPAPGADLRTPAGDVQDNTPAEGERLRTLAELYADMEALGLNVDDMTQVLHRAQREAPADAVA